MTITYLKEAKNLQELKKLYFKLSKENHPDLGGTLEAMQAINNEYDYLKTVLKNAKDTKQAEKENIKTMTAARTIIEELIKYPNLKIEIVGSWLWVSGYGTYKIKQEVIYDKFHFRYSKGQKKFFWFEGIEESGTCKGGYLEKAKEKYGVETIKSNPTLSLT